MIIGVEHVAIAANDRTAVVELFRRFGLDVVYREDLADEHVRAEQLDAGNAAVEILTPLDDSAPVARFLAERGPGLHHVCFRVDDVEATIADLRRAGLELASQQPREDGQGRRVFLHPRSGHGVLMGFVERKDAP